MAVSQKFNTELPCGPAILLMAIYPKELNLAKQTYFYACVNRRLVHQSQNMEATHVSISEWITKFSYAILTFRKKGNSDT